MAAVIGLKGLFLQSDLDARNWTILNLDLSGLNLTKASVGLGNVDNTSDAAKPLSNAAVVALALKENAITAGTEGQFWQGDKTWVDYGALALQNGNTTLQLISVIAPTAADSAILSAKRDDFGSSNVETAVRMLGASTFGDILTGLPGANVGLLTFRGTSYGVIATNNAAPLVFGTNNAKRARIGLGLSVGTDTEAGSGCILATGTITAGTFEGSGASLTGITKDQIPGTLNATVMPRLTINGVGGAGYVLLGTQSSNPVVSAPLLFANSLGRICLQGALNPFNISFATDGLSANRIYGCPDVAGTIAVGTKDTGWTAWTGAGSKATKLVSTATTGDCAAAIKSILDALIAYNIVGA